MFRTWFNGWCTARRFQVKRARCLLGCGAGSTEGCCDSIEHYACCPVMLEFATKSLNLPPALVGGLLNFLCLQSNLDSHLRTRQLLLLYACYSATNCLRFGQPHLAANSMHEFLLQYVHQGASQSASAQQVVSQYVTHSRRLRRRVASADAMDLQFG